jgi:hypothetical protein
VHQTRSKSKLYIALAGYAFLRAINFPKEVRDFFSYFDIFNQYLRNEPGQKLFLNLGLLSHVSLSGVTYEGVMPVHMT